MSSFLSFRLMAGTAAVAAACFTAACSQSTPTAPAAEPEAPDASQSEISSSAGASAASEAGNGGNGPSGSVAAIPSAATPVPTITIDFETRVRGFSNSGRAGWIRVTSACGGGGRVVGAGTTSACTDRVSRGEPIRVTLTTGAGRRGRIAASADLRSDNLMTPGVMITLPFTRTFTVSPNPRFDNAFVGVTPLSATGVPLGPVQQRRVPIGSRP